MDFPRRAAARADADDIYAMPNPSPDAHMTIDALRRELLHEGIRQQFIVAELAKRQELEDEFRDRFRQTTMPHRCASPLPHGGPFAGSAMSRRPVKDRIEEWYQPPWCREIDEADAVIAGAALSGVKRKRTADTQPSICSICNVICYYETDLQKHLRGRKHQKKLEALKGKGKGTEEKLHEKEAPQLVDKNKKE
ncbi:uncharacterized protein [Lolium perenne]|uniref:uncharacterized protein n=1 Tax=Lolium perenne TaxID=4522 RepID=UPI0021F57ED9|nr:uncharacterized protein LOC127318428 [Lolium perenne]